MNLAHQFIVVIENLQNLIKIEAYFVIQIYLPKMTNNKIPFISF